MSVFYSIVRSAYSKQKNFSYFTNATADGCFTTLENLEHFYRNGDTITKVYVGDNDSYRNQSCNCCYYPLVNKSWKNEKAVKLTQSYPLYSISTIMRFKLKITEDYILHCILLGEIEVIEWCQKNVKFEGLFKDGINLSNVLYFSDGLLDQPTFDWLLKCGIKLTYTDLMMDHVSILTYNRVFILEWLKNSGLPLLYTEKALRWATTTKNLDVLDWWKNSGLELKRDDDFLKTVSAEEDRCLDHGTPWTIQNHSGIAWWYHNYGVNLGC